MNRKVLKNASWIIGCKVGQSIMQLIIGMISARYLGPSNYGLIGYATSIVAFVLPVMQLGFSKTLVREIIERPDQEGKVLGTAIVMNLISALACMISVYVFLYLSNPDDGLTILVGVLCSISLVFQATEILQYWFQAKLLSKYTSIVSLIAYVISASYKVFLLITKKPVTWFAIYNSLDYFLISFALLVIYAKVGTQKLTFSISLGEQMIRRSKHYIVATMMVTIFQQTDRIMLKNIIGDSENGYYTAAIACVGITSFVFIAIEDSFRPNILENKRISNYAYENSVVQLYSIVIYLALAQSVIMTIFAKPIILLLYGEQYVNSIAPLQISVWYTTFGSCGAVRNIWILAEEKQRFLWIINLSGAVANVVLNFLLIPPFGAVGAAFASLVTQFLANVVIVYLIPPLRNNNSLMLKGLNPKPLISATKICLRKIKNRRSL